MTFIEKFEALKKKYGKIDESQLSEAFAAQIELTDEDCGGIFYVAYMNGTFAVEPYDYHDNTVSIKVSGKVLEKILSCKSDPVAEYLIGHLKVQGNLNHALMLVNLMKKQPVKRASKKAADAPEKEAKPAKKSAAKKTAK